MATNSFSFLYRKNPLQPYSNTSVNSSYAQTNPISAYGSTLVPTSNKSVAQPKTTTTQSKVIPASGYGTQYAQNQSNYKAPVITPKPLTTTSNAYTNPFIDRMKQTAEQRAGYTLSQADEQAKRLQESQQRQAERLQGLIPQYQQSFDTYKNNTLGQIADEEARAKTDKTSAQDYYGGALRRGAEANRQSMGQLQDLFAGLGTIDSRAFQNQTINQQSKFAGGQQSILQEQAAKLEEIDRGVADFRRTAQSAIQQEESNLQQQIVDIQNTLDAGSVEYENAIQAAYAQAYEKVSEIDDQLAQVELEAYQRQQALEAEAAKGNPVGEAQLSQVSDFDNSIKQVNGLTELIDQYASMMGPIQGRLNSVNPYNKDAQVFNSQMKAVAQMVGRAMEGGVLRQEDVPKYEAILPKITDTPETAKGKIQNVASLLTGQRNQRSSAFQQAGYTGTNQVALQSNGSQLDPAVIAYLQANGLQ